MLLLALFTILFPLASMAQARFGGSWPAVETDVVMHDPTDDSGTTRLAGPAEGTPRGFAVVLVIGLAPSSVAVMAVSRSQHRDRHRLALLWARPSGRAPPAPPLGVPQLTASSAGPHGPPPTSPVAR
jgi:hypothetical protein